MGPGKLARALYVIARLVGPASVLHIRFHASKTDSPRSADPATARLSTLHNRYLEGFLPSLGLAFPVFFIQWVWDLFLLTDVEALPKSMVAAFL